MYSRSRLSPERCAVLAAVMGAHVLLFVLLSKAHSNLAPAPDSDSPTSAALEWVDLTERPSAPAPPPENSSAGRSGRPPRQRVDIPTTAPTAAITESAPENPWVDWKVEAERAASATIDKMAQQEKRRCADPKQPSPLLPKCKGSSAEFRWDPEPKKAGFIGILPYVRLGKRCIVGLGFFNCVIGTLPEANGHLLDHMGDPDLERQSVPDINE